MNATGTTIRRGDKRGPFEKRADRKKKNRGGGG